MIRVTFFWGKAYCDRAAYRSLATKEGLASTLGLSVSLRLALRWRRREMSLMLNGQHLDGASS